MGIASIWYVTRCRQITVLTRMHRVAAAEWEELLGGRTRESLTRQQKGSLALAGVFESSKTLKKVNLSNSHLGFTGTRAVERAFAANSHKIEFDVRPLRAHC